MKKYIFLPCVITLLACTGSLSGQVRWTLRQCIDYALENNIEIKQQELAVQESEIDLRDYRFARLPDLSAGISQNFSFGRAPSPETNTYDDSQTSSTGVSASSSIPVYQGGALRNRIKVGRLDLKAAVESLESAKENLELQVTVYYLEVLYRRELLKVYRQELALSQKQLQRAEVLVETGLSPRTELLETRAQVASNIARVTAAARDVDNALLDLAQALNLGDFYGFDIVDPDLDAVQVDNFTLSPPGEVYAAALAVKPHIREMEYRLESSIANVRVVRGSLYPTINFGVSYSNGYSYVFSDNNQSFAKQIRTRGNEAVGFNISIPIYNRGHTRSNIKRAQLGVRSRELYLENTKLNIYKEIQQATLDAQNAVAEYNASETAMEASREAYNLMEESFNLGRTTALELEESRSKLITSLSEQVRTKYSFIFRSKIIDFYKGVPITL
ncbi:MAG: TolC family protein [Alistipes sp.]|nr:TolC family protein [Alistipes sp.]